MPNRVLDNQYYAALVQRIRAGSEDAFAELYAETWPDLARYAKYILKDDDLVPDALQEIYIAVYKNIDKLRMDTLLLPWMRQITYRQCIDMYRKNRANREVSSEFAPDSFVLDRLSLHDLLGYGGRDELEDVHIRELRAQLNAALRALPVEKRQAFLLRYEYDLKLEEIADFLNCSVASVKRHIAYARQQLQKDLAHMREYV